MFSYRTAPIPNQSSLRENSSLKTCHQSYERSVTERHSRLTKRSDAPLINDSHARSSSHSQENATIFSRKSNIKGAREHQGLSRRDILAATATAFSLLPAGSVLADDVQDDALKTWQLAFQLPLLNEQKAINAACSTMDAKLAAAFSKAVYQVVVSEKVLDEEAFQIEAFRLHQQEYHYYYEVNKERLPAIPDLSDLSGGLSNRTYFNFVNYILWKVVAKHVTEEDARSRFSQLVGDRLMVALAPDLVKRVRDQPTKEGLQSAVDELLSRLKAGGYLCEWQVVWDALPAALPRNWFATVAHSVQSTPDPAQTSSSPIPTSRAVSNQLTNPDTEGPTRVPTEGPTRPYIGTVPSLQKNVKESGDIWNVDVLSDTTGSRLTNNAPHSNPSPHTEMISDTLGSRLPSDTLNRRMMHNPSNGTRTLPDTARIVEAIAQLHREDVSGMLVTASNEEVGARRNVMVADVLSPTWRVDTSPSLTRTQNTTSMTVDDGLIGIMGLNDGFVQRNTAWSESESGRLNHGFVQRHTAWSEIESGRLNDGFIQRNTAWSESESGSEFSEVVSGDVTSGDTSSSGAGFGESDTANVLSESGSNIEGIAGVENELSDEEMEPRGMFTFQVRLHYPADIEGSVALRAEEDGFWSQVVSSMLQSLLHESPYLRGATNVAVDQYFFQDEWGGPRGLFDRVLLFWGDPLQQVEVPWEPTTLVQNWSVVVE